MVGLVEHAVLAGRQDAHLRRRVARLDEADLARHRAPEADQDETLVAGLADAEIERRVPLLVDDRVGFRVRSQHVLLDPRREQCDRIVFDVVDGPVVARPGDRAAQPGDALGQVAAGRDLAEAQSELEAAAGVFGEGQQVLPWADGPAAEAVVLLPFGFAVRVDQHLLPVRAQRPPDEDGILLAGLEARGVEVILVFVRDRAVVLLDPPDQFFGKGFGELPVRRAHGLVVGVLGLQVVEHLGLGARVVAQPVIGIVARAVGRDHVIGFDGCDGRGRRLHRAGDAGELLAASSRKARVLQDHAGILRRPALRSSSRPRRTASRASSGRPVRFSRSANR